MLPPVLPASPERLWSVPFREGRSVGLGDLSDSSRYLGTRGQETALAILANSSYTPRSMEEKEFLQSVVFEKVVKPIFFFSLYLVTLRVGAHN